MSARVSVAILDQYATDEDSVMCSALSHTGLSTLSEPVKAESDSAATVALLERPVTGLLLLRATGSAEALSKALIAQCGVALSSRLRSNVKGEFCVRWMSPDSWLLSCPLDEAFSLENTLHKAVDGHMAVVNVSGGYTILELSGVHARNVLMKSTGYDTHPDHLPVGKVVNTTFAKTQVTMQCLELGEASNRYELIVRRSFSDYVWLWLARASAEYGCESVDQTG
ncbi:MAG: sarcosine oxidase subunit gamma [Granulosicoccus sp.]